MIGTTKPKHKESFLSSTNNLVDFSHSLFEITFKTENWMLKHSAFSTVSEILISEKLISQGFNFCKLKTKVWLDIF